MTLLDTKASTGLCESDSDENRLPLKTDEKRLALRGDHDEFSAS